MKRVGLIFFVLLFFLQTVISESKNPTSKKISSWVQSAVSQQHSHRNRTMSAHKQYMTVFIQSEEASDNLLSMYGCHIYAQLGDITITSIPIDQIEPLSQHPSILRIEANSPAQLTMDTVPSVINALPIYTPTSQHSAFTGKNVIIGVMDVGFDLTHPNFFNNATLDQYRIGAFWDQLSTDTIGSPFSVGRDYVGQEVVLAQKASIDAKTQTHGTHTLGIAAGCGYTSPYRGIAFESDICLVSNAVSSDTIYISPKDYYKYTTATDALGFKYLFDYADKQGKPCVVSFSEGYSPYLDQEDSLYAAFIEKLIGPGHILVASAGNENSTLTYAEKPSGIEAAGAFLYIHKKRAAYRIKSNGPFILSLYAYQHQNSTPSHTLKILSDNTRHDTQYTDTLFIDADTCAINIDRYHSTMSNDTIYNITITANRPINELPYIALVAEGANSHVEIYGSSSNPLINRSIDSRWNAATYGHNILAPGCFSAPICVGSTSHRPKVINYQGTPLNWGGNNDGKRSAFSSTGPSINGLMKPEISAPGANIISSYSIHYLDAHHGEVTECVSFSSSNEKNYPWAMSSGTSMSTPVVAGIIALWLEANPTLTREDILGILSRTSRHPDETLNYPNNEYGYGEIDGYRGLLDILGVSNIKNISQNQPQAVQVFIQDGRLILRFNKKPTMPLSVYVYSLAGYLEFQGTLSSTQETTTLSLPHLVSGIHLVQIQGEKIFTGSELVRY